MQGCRELAVGYVNRRVDFACQALKVGLPGRKLREHSERGESAGRRIWRIWSSRGMVRLWQGLTLKMPSAMEYARVGPGWTERMRLGVLVPMYTLTMVEFHEYDMVRKGRRR